MNNTHAFHPLARLLHWTMAVLILAMLFVGVGMVTTVSQKHQWLLAIHRPLGATLLVLVIVRLIVRLRFKPPALPADMPGGHIRNANLFRAKIENAPAHNWTGLVGSGIREIDSLSGSPPRDAAIPVAIAAVTEPDGGKPADPCSEPPPAKP